MAQALGVEMWGQHIRVVSQGPRQQRDRRGEGAEDPDDVGVRGQLLGPPLGFSVSAKRDKCMRSGTEQLERWSSRATRNTAIHLFTRLFVKYLLQVCVPGIEPGVRVTDH